MDVPSVVEREYSLLLSLSEGVSRRIFALRIFAAITLGSGLAYAFSRSEDSIFLVMALLAVALGAMQAEQSIVLRDYVRRLLKIERDIRSGDAYPPLQVIHARTPLRPGISKIYALWPVLLPYFLALFIALFGAGSVRWQQSVAAAIHQGQGSVARGSCAAPAFANSAACPAIERKRPFGEPSPAAPERENVGGRAWLLTLLALIAGAVGGAWLGSFRRAGAGGDAYRSASGGAAEPRPATPSAAARTGIAGALAAFGTAWIAMSKVEGAVVISLPFLLVPLCLALVSGSAHARWRWWALALASLISVVAVLTILVPSTDAWHFTRWP
ncbi:MAG: hypothetical protein JO013_04865, partial [Alphaproteobacteria bacterium]|nr:hypothetical protein [Alphaproteobacteria bacterium]